LELAEDLEKDGKRALELVSSIAVTKQHYNAVPAVQLSRTRERHKAIFSWEKYRDQVKRDIQIAEKVK